MESIPAPEETAADMNLMDHLRELRTRLLYAFAAIAVATICCFMASAWLFDLLTRPFHETFSGFELIGTGPAEAFVLKLKAAFFAGIVLASPVIFMQVWLFIAPGLYEHERKMAVPFVIFTTLLFAIGVGFAYEIVIPYAFEFFKAEYQSIGVTPTIRISEFLSITIRILLGFGLVFETPMIAFFLGRLGLITDAFLIQYFRHAIVLIFIVAALLTPPDLVTQILMAVPLVILYGVSILIVRFTGRTETPEPEE